jgi:hypothetical protein
MITHALGVSFRQALRSVLVVFFPLSFISLFAWATAGSVNANSVDPIRASVWLWLGAHQIPFHVPTGKLTFLPLLALLFPVLALRRNFAKVEVGFSKLHGARLFYSLWYALFIYLLAIASISHQVRANLIAAPLYGFVIAYISTVKINRKKFQHLFFALYSFAILLGISALVFAVSLAMHWQILQKIEIVIAPGWIGGTLFTLIQLLYLPNIALITLSYLTGIGFSMGAQTMISPQLFSLHQIPAIPLLSALPTGRHPVLRFGIGALLFLGLLLFWQIRRSYSGFALRSRYGLLDALRFLLVLALFIYLSSGELLTPALNPVGINFSRFMTVMAIIFLGSAIVVLCLPEVSKKLRGLVHHD